MVLVGLLWAGCGTQLEDGSVMLENSEGMAAGEAGWTQTFRAGTPEPPVLKFICSTGDLRPSCSAAVLVRIDEETVCRVARRFFTLHPDLTSYEVSLYTVYAWRGTDFAVDDLVAADSLIVRVERDDRRADACGGITQHLAADPDSDGWTLGSFPQDELVSLIVKYEGHRATTTQESFDELAGRPITLAVAAGWR
jgi:hypothetical protein